MSLHSIDVTEEDFEEKVIKASHDVPVVIDFWAEWCGPCRVLKPLLEKLAAEYNGKFILAKIDSDENMRIAGRYKVRGIPTVVAVVKGEEAGRFSGALPEGQVRKFLDGLLPSPIEEMRQAALESYHAGDHERAMKILAAASIAAPDNLDIQITAAEILLHSGKPEEARQILEALPYTVQSDDKVVTLRARLQFADKADGGADTAAFEARIAVNADDLEARLELARLCVAHENYADAMAQLLEIVKRDRSFREDIGRKTLLDVFNLLGGSGELVSQYRKLLAMALH